MVQPKSPTGGGRDGQYEDGEQAPSHQVCQPVRRLEQHANPHETASQRRDDQDPPPSSWARYQHSQAHTDHHHDHVARWKATAIVTD